MDWIPGRSTWSALGPATNRADLFPVSFFGRHHKSARIAAHGVCIRMDQSTRWGVVINRVMTLLVNNSTAHRDALGTAPL